jgi:SPP1 family holin
MEAGTLIRTNVLVVVLVNQLAVSFTGTSIVPIPEDQVDEGVASILVTVAAIWSWWKNNSITKEAQQADAVLDQLKHLPGPVSEIHTESDAASLVVESKDAVISGKQREKELEEQLKELHKELERMKEEKQKEEKLNLQKRFDERHQELLKAVNSLKEELQQFINIVKKGR